MSDAPLNTEVAEYTERDERAPTLRYRVTFSSGGPLAFLSVLELGKVWERSLRRAGAPLRYSQGFNPRPKIQFALPLPTGCGGEAEWLDLWLDESWEPARLQAALEGCLPTGLRVRVVETVPEAEPGLAERVIAAEYTLWLHTISASDVQAAIATLLATERVLRPRRGKYRGQDYDLRPLIESLELTPAPAPWVGLALRGTALPRATGRPDEVVDALGLAAYLQRCTRQRIILNNFSTEDE